MMMKTVTEKKDGVEINKNTSVANLLRINTCSVYLDLAAKILTFSCLISSSVTNEKVE